MKNSKIRLTALVLAVLMLIGLSACDLPFEIPGITPNPTEGPTDPTEAPVDPTDPVDPSLPDVNYTVKFYYEATELGTYGEPEVQQLQAKEGTKVTAPDGARDGFALNEETSVVAIESVAEGAELKVYYDRIRVQVKFDYITKEDATYTAAYGVGIVETQEAVWYDGLSLLGVDCYLNGTKGDLTADSFKALTADASVTFEVQSGDWSYEEGYVPGSAEVAPLYAPAFAGNQSFTTTIRLSTMENAISDTGIAISSGDTTTILYMTGAGKNLNLILGGLDGSVTGLLSEEATTFVDGACKINVIIKDGMLYVVINDVACGAVALENALPGYTAESAVKIGLYGKNAASDLVSFSEVVHTTEGEITAPETSRWEEKITFVPELALGVKLDFVNASFASIPGKLNRVTMNGASKTWEVSGTAERLTDDLKAEDFCIGFMIESNGKTLRMSATREGLVFEAHDGHGRYAYHAFGISHYNLNTKTGAFAFGEKRTQSKMHFKVQIIDDVFYAYYWFDGEEPTLCWYVPLTETLTGVDGGAAWTDNPFTGFAPDSEYKLHLFNNTTATPGQFTNLVVKNGDSVDKTQAPKYAALIGVGTKDANGDISILANKGTSIKFAGNSATWEVSGAVERNGTDALCMGFNLRAGGKSLRISATTRGPVFEAHSGHGRYAYHAIIGNGTTTQYVKSTINLDKFAAAKSESKMYYKAVIANDMLYVWFWFEGEEPVLAWEIPLTETLTGTSGGPAWTDNPFTGFAAGSTYTLELFNNNSASTGKFSGITVKTGADVDTSIITPDTPEA
ncbi:MAG: hypothetical protein E7461_03900 [Ruminococcaceae bacterium]|nr:hypothetical protein [Oscillospiraceae bacterium]